MTTPRIIRVFPRKTKATPTDALTYFGPPDQLAETDEVHVSVTFSYDRQFAEYLAARCAFQRRWARPAIIHARETIPYGRSPADRARVKAARRAQAIDAKDQENLRPAGRPKTENVSNDESDRNNSRPVGTTAAYAIRRLRRDRPDIHARVLAGEITPHAGMIEAGFRKKPPPPRKGRKQ
jgi:hypothetical protein